MKLNSPKIYRNKKARNHPGIEIVSDNETWKNMIVTHNPIKSKRYIKLKKNLNELDKRDSYVEKRLRNDSIKTRGKLLLKYHLSDEDQTQVEEFLRKKVSVQPTKLGPSAHQSDGSNTNNNIKTKKIKRFNKKS